MIYVDVNETINKKNEAEDFINNNKELFLPCDLLTDVSTWGEYSEEAGKNNTIMVTFHNIPIKRYVFYFENDKIIEVYDISEGKEKIY